MNSVGVGGMGDGGEQTGRGWKWWEIDFFIPPPDQLSGAGFDEMLEGSYTMYTVARLLNCFVDCWLIGGYCGKLF